MMLLVSFAREAEAVLRRLLNLFRGRDINVFYDKYEKAFLWGEGTLSAACSDVYQKQAVYCVMFVSKFYAAKLWTNHERQFAQARAFNREILRTYCQYVWTIQKYQDLPPTVGYLDWKAEAPGATIADAIIRKLGRESFSRVFFRNATFYQCQVYGNGFN